MAVSYADSPDGPWIPYNKIVIPNGAQSQWDQYSIHDPYPLVYKGKIYLYYKSDCDLSLDLDDPQMKKHHVYHKPEVYYKQGLTLQQLKRIMEENRKLRER